MKRVTKDKHDQFRIVLMEIFFFALYCSAVYFLGFACSWLALGCFPFVTELRLVFNCALTLLLIMRQLKQAG